MVDIRIRDLPTASPAVPTDFVAIDNGSTRKVAISDLVDVGRPLASQAEAEAGTEPTKAMSPLTTAQAIGALALTPASIGTTVQPFSPNLSTLAGVAPGAAGTSILALSLANDVRNFLDTAPYVATRTALKALDTTKDVVAILMENGREGIFNWKTGDYSTHIAADTQEGIYVKADAIAATSGAWVRVVPAGADIVAEWFGAIGYSMAQLVALNGEAQVDVDAAVNDTAWATAFTMAKFLGGVVVFGGAQFYVRTQTRAIGQGCGVAGAGVGNWNTIYPLRPKTWEGTTHIMKGTVPGARTIDGITSCEVSGGWRPDPDNLGQYFKLTSATNRDATGTTPATKKNFSAGFMNETDARYIRARDLRVTNWCGQNGIEGHSDTGSTSLGDDLDFNFLLVNCEYANFQRVQGVGYAREAGLGYFIDRTINSHGERSSFYDCTFQGRVGRIIRGPDRSLIIGTPTWNGSTGTGDCQEFCV